MLNEETLISECLKNNRIAQKELYDKFASTLMGVCIRYTNSREDAEDVLIEGFTTIFQKLEMYKGEGSFEGWMKRIMVNTAISHFRQNSKYRFHQNIDDVFDVSEKQETVIEQMEAKRILQLVNTMPEGYRVVFNLYAVEGFNHREIGEMLSISEGTSKSQFSKARKWLQKRLNT
ncbi:MAG: sigma-70 family RNA polymerase sigma factor [Bacteroidales bacterium]|nr:sigma-70 family RNA polymerase sigma factor [Bacteroidales bacterium]MDY0215314.1 sigma-70 family RNA polymerase sigma factor [Bacteroidales bacterium]